MRPQTFVDVPVKSNTAQKKVTVFDSKQELNPEAESSESTFPNALPDTKLFLSPDSPHLLQPRKT